MFNVDQHEDNNVIALEDSIEAFKVNLLTPQ